MMKWETYNWNDIQKEYDSGQSFRDLISKYGMSFGLIREARLNGKFKSRSLSDARKLVIKKIGPNIMSDASKKRLSQSMSEHNPGGKCKWYEVDGKKVQGSWERDFAYFLNENNIIWERCKSIPYQNNGLIKRYTPDFYLPAFNLYVEIKGRWWGNDKKKMELVLEQNPNINIVIIHNKKFEEILSHLS